MKSLILPIIVLIVCVTGIYFSLEQKRLFEEEQNLRLEKKDENIRITALADAKEVDLKKAKEALAETQRIKSETEVRIANLKSEAATMRSEIKEQEAFLAVYKRQEKKLEETTAEVDALADKLDLDFDIDDIEEFLNDMKETKEQRVTKLDELDVLITGAEKSIEENTSELARQVAREERRQMKITRSGLEAVITGVQQDWGFLVIGAGSNSGFTPQSELIVERDGRMIAKIRPSSIEPTQTIAEINFDTLEPGVRIQPGDKVIIRNPFVD